jgi:hypothetical protein
VYYVLLRIERNNNLNSATKEKLRVTVPEEL